MTPDPIPCAITRRIVPCLDVRDGQVVKGVRFADHRVVGDITALASRYAQDGADELVFYDITASPEGRSVDREWVSAVARLLDIPFCVAGGIRSVEDAEGILHAGADKVSINTPALRDPALIDRLAKRFGSQCVVIGIDAKPDDAGIWRVYRDTGSDSTRRGAGRELLPWLGEVQARGAGEIVLNCMNQDGVRRGYDLDGLKAAREVTRVPLIASGGAGTLEHFASVFKEACVDAALAASVFHSGEIRIPDLKAFLTHADIAVRPV
ncbi:MAG: imidazole glycerol phosphate synthase subunit HisF [Pseudomonadota bacterium]